MILRQVERLIERRKLARYHASKNAEARRSLGVVEARRGKTPRALLRQCDEYAADVLGWRGYAPGLYVYAATQARFVEGWIPGNYYGSVVIPATSGDFGSIAAWKSLSGFLLRSEHLPDLAVAICGRFYDPALNPIPEAELRERLFASADCVVFKLDASNKGRGIHLFVPDTLDPAEIKRLGSGVFQSFVRQHPELARFSPTATATLRMTSVVEPDGDVSVRAAYLRVGRVGEAFVRASSQLRIVVDPGDGTFRPVAYTAEGGEITAHPDTGAAFLGHAVPNYPACVEVVRALHRRVPFVSCIGWDITVDAAGSVRLMEWNGRHNAISFSEAVAGPCFRGLGWEHLWRAHRPRLSARVPGA